MCSEKFRLVTNGEPDVFHSVPFDRVAVAPWNLEVWR
jgi:hypothetical protein